MRDYPGCRCVFLGNGVSSMNGKGDKARPMKVSRDKFNDNFDRIFGKKPEPKAGKELKRLAPPYFKPR